MARTHFPGENPLGKRVWLGWEEDGVRRGGEIVGVVDDVRQFGLDRPSEPEMYLPVRSDAGWTDDGGGAHVGVAGGRVRGRARGGARARSGSAAVRAQHAPAAVRGVGSAAAALHDAAGHVRGVAVLLAAIGLYGVVSYSVRQQTHEIGIRLALGATRSNVAGMVVGSSLTVTVVGAALGLAGALAVSRLLQALLVRGEPDRPVDVRRRWSALIRARRRPRELGPRAPRDGDRSGVGAAERVAGDRDGREAYGNATGKRGNADDPRGIGMPLVHES